MKTSLRQHLRRAYGAIIALALCGAILLADAAAFAWQCDMLIGQARQGLEVYAMRLAREPGPVSLALIERITRGTSHPGWVLHVVTPRTRYIVQWDPYGVVVQPRSVGQFGAASLGLGQRLRDAESLLRVHTLVGGCDLGLFPRRAVGALVRRTAAIAIAGVALSLACGLLLGDRLARRALAPLDALIRSLRDSPGLPADGSAPPPLAVTGPAEIAELIAVRNVVFAERYRAEKERAEADARIHRFIADAGHHLRTPLTVLSGFISIMRRGQLRDPGDAPVLLEKMERQIDVLKRLVQRLILLENWESEPPVPRRVAVAELVATAIEPLASAFPDRDVRVTVAADAEVSVAAEEISHAIVNIVANALKFSDGPVAIDVDADETSVTVAVGDGGRGIPPEELSRVFQRFFRGTNREVPGSGLGLAIAQLAVERAHGTIAVDSVPGRGTTFRIILPRISAGTAQPAERLEPSLQ